MARVWSDGAEFGDILFWDATSGTVSASTTQKRSGAYSYSLGSGVLQKNIADYAEFYVRYAFYFTAGGETRLSVRHSTTVLDYIRNNFTLGRMEAYAGGVLVKTGTGVVQPGWNLIEVHFNIADAGNIDVYLNGVYDIDYDGDTKPGADAHIDNLYFNGYNTANYLDDLGLDTATYCGDGHIELLTPNDNGDVNDWTGSDGDKVNNYLLIDDIPASGDDYIKSNTSLQQDICKVTDFTPTGKVITRVWPECRAKDNDATSGQIKIGMKTASVHLSSAITLSGNYARVVGDEELTNPADGTAWEDADLDSIQFVAECE